MIRNTFSHSRCSLLPLASGHAHALAQSTMRADEIVVGVIQLRMPLQHVPIFRKGQHLPAGPTIAVAHVQVVPLHVARIDLVAAATGVKRLLNLLGGAEDNLARHFHYAVLLPLLMDLRIPQMRIHHPFGILSGSARPPFLFGIRRLFRAVMGQDRFRIRTQFVTEEQRRPTITSSFHLVDKLLGIVQRVFTDVADDPQARGGLHAFPDPSVTDLVRIILRGVDPLLLFFIARQSRGMGFCPLLLDDQIQRLRAGSGSSGRAQKRSLLLIPPLWGAKLFFRLMTNCCG